MGRDSARLTTGSGEAMNKQRVQWISLVMVLALVLSACAGSSGTSDEIDAGANPNTVETTGQVDSPTTEDTSNSGSADAPETDASDSGGSSDGDLVVCPVIVEHDVELGTILGFEVDPESSGAPTASECFIRGANIVDFAEVELVGSFMPSIEFQVEGYEGVALPAPELGDDAVFIDSDFQPRVVFLLGDRIIDVGAEVEGTTLSYDVMIAYALRVKELLVEANG